MEAYRSQRNNSILVFVLASILLLAAGSENRLLAQAQVRLKDISRLSGNREYQVLGYGLVTGLDATGDKSEMSIEMTRGMLQKMGMELTTAQIQSKNVAAVIVTGMLPSYGRAGEPFDITISSIGDAKSLQGGVLLPTLLKGGDGQVYAVAQGKVSIGGFESGAGGAAAGKAGQKNHLTVGYVPNGAIMERGVDDRFARSGKFSVLLQEKDTVLTRKVKEAIDRRYGIGWATIVNPGHIEVRVPSSMSDDPVSFAANIENLPMSIEEPNRVVINERTGTVIVGSNVRISKVVISHNGIRIEIDDQEQPAGNAATKRNQIQGSMVAVQGETTVDDLVAALNAVGATPKDLIAIFQAVNAAGALHGELKIM
ncbi:MAG: flagellar biosynthesis protein FlgA [Candidatus Riflebacteria bacterium HGW-Riflebacteria-2]|jgi:flagellar P-ring protein precursor FlgI|nr:MAG: flagellar biosynthesis protein FlgA [Candidatus Riflebacteria bacterium HGW-Riflebacteria-2]